MRIVIDPGKCIWAGNCEADLPEFFEVQPDDATEVVTQPGEERRRDVEWVVGNCPSGAISITE